MSLEVQEAKMDKQISSTMSRKEEVRKRIEKLQHEETKLVKGKFLFHECPGGAVKISVKKFKDVPVFTETFVDGLTYEIPLYVARHLNGFDKCALDLGGIINSCAVPINRHAMNADGTPRIDIGSWRRRISFQSMDFLN